VCVFFVPGQTKVMEGARKAMQLGTSNEGQMKFVEVVFFLPDRPVTVT